MAGSHQVYTYIYIYTYTYIHTRVTHFQIFYNIHIHDIWGGGLGRGHYIELQRNWMSPEVKSTPEAVDAGVAAAEAMTHSELHGGLEYILIIYVVVACEMAMGQNPVPPPIPTKLD